MGYTPENNYTVSDFFHQMSRFNHPLNTSYPDPEKVLRSNDFQSLDMITKIRVMTLGYFLKFRA